MVQVITHLIGVKNEIYSRRSISAVPISLLNGQHYHISNMVIHSMKEDQLNDLIDEAIKQLSSDDINTGADCLVEIAHLYARAGLPQHLFGGIRQYIINEAEKRTDKLFIQEKLKLAERNNQNGRIFSTSSSH